MTAVPRDRDIPVDLVRYEDMQVDTVGTFRHALRFAARPATDKEIQRAAAFANMAELRRQEREQGFRERSRAGTQFFRCGVAGAWRDELSAEQVARIEAAHAPMMLRLGYELAGAMPLARTG